MAGREKASGKPGAVQRAVRLFTEVVGADIPVDAITTDDVREFKQALLKMPRMLTDGLKKKTVPELIQAVGTLADDQKLSAASVNKRKRPPDAAAILA